VTGKTKFFKGDSGGPLYVLENEKRAVLVGIVNRGEGCARKNSMGIYARFLLRSSLEFRNCVIFGVHNRVESEVAVCTNVGKN
jgi:hypothetical protein